MASMAEEEDMEEKDEGEEEEEEKERKIGLKVGERGRRCEENK